MRLRGLIVAACLAAGAPALAQERPPPIPNIADVAAFSEDDLLLVEVVVGDAQLTDSLGVYGSRGGIYVPLGEFARLLDLAIVVKPPEAAAEGWILSENRLVRVELKTRTLRTAAGTTSFAPDQAILLRDEIYVRLDLLEQMLPVRLKPELSDLRLTVTPTEPLPMQERLKREGVRLRLGADGPEEVLDVPAPYRLFTPPAFDINVQTENSSRQTVSTARYDLRAAGDVAFGNIQVFAGSDEDSRISDVRAIWERRSPEGRILGPLGLRRVAVGDVFVPTLAMGARSYGGRGAIVSNQPAEQASIFNTIDLRGELPLGYEAELYVNEVLQFSQAASVQGRYEFLNVPLSYGMNVLRVVLFGPRGERRDEVRRINVGGGLAPKGKVRFSLGAVEQSLPLVDVRNAPLDPSFEFGDPGRGTLRASGAVAYGLTNTLTLGAGLAQYTPRKDDERTVGVFNLRSSLAGYSLQADIGTDSAGGTGVALGFAGRSLGLSFFARHAEFRGGFIDETQLAGLSEQTSLVRSTEIRADGVVRVFRAFTPVSLNLYRDQSLDSSSNLRASLRASTNVRSFLVASQFNYDRSRPASGATQSRLSGVVDATGALRGGWQVRAGVTYDVAPEFAVHALNLTLDRPIGRRSALRIGVIQEVDSRRATALQVTNTWRFSRFDAAITGGYNTANSEFRVGFQLATGLLFDPLRHAYRQVRPGAAAGGAMAVRAFVDDNGNGRRDLGERPVPGLALGNADRAAVTDKEGRALVSGLGDGVQARVPVQVETIEDPYLATPPAILRTVPRPGQVAVANYGLRATGEVMLKALVRRPGDQMVGLSALLVELVDAKGVVAARGRTEYDGTVLIDRLPVGAYTLRIAPQQAQQLGLALPRSVTVQIPPGGGYVGQIDAEVEIRRGGE